MLKEITIKVPEEAIPNVVSLVSILLKYSGNDPYINNNLLKDLVVVKDNNNISNNNNNNLSTTLNNNNKDKYSNYEVGYIPNEQEVVDYVFYKGYDKKFDAYEFLEQMRRSEWKASGQKVRYWTKMIDYFVGKNWCPGSTNKPSLELPESVAK